MTIDSEPYSRFCFINATFRGGGRFAFAGSLSLSLLFHLAVFSAFALLRENAERTPHKHAVIEIDLSAIETAGSSKSPPAPIPVYQRPAEGKPLNRAAKSSERSVRPAIEHAAQKKQNQPYSAINPEKDKAITVNEMHAGTPLAGTATTAPAAGEKAAGTPSGALKEGAGDRHGDRDEGSESRNGNGHGTKAALADYCRTVRSLIERRKEYPPAARKLGIQGSVIVSFSLNCRGELQGVSLEKSSGNSMIDNAGIRAVRNVGSFPPPPRHAMQGEIVSFKIPIKFALAAG